MDGDIVLRVGICECKCSKSNLGSIDDQIITQTAFSSRGRLFGPLTFRIREYAIPIEEEDEYLEGYRCHFFWDMHPNLTRGHQVYNVEFSLLEIHEMNGVSLVHPGGYTIDLFNVQTCFRWLALPEPPAPGLVLEAMGNMLQELRNHGLRRWLRTMTPRGWEPPPPAT